MARRKVATEPVLRDWAAVDNALRDLRECRHALTELGVERDRQLDALKDEYSRQALPLQNRVKRLESDIKEFVDTHRAELIGKSRSLTFGRVGYRVSARLILAPTKVADAIAMLKSLGRKDLIKTSESLDREALRREPADLLESIGAYVRSSDEFYYDIEANL